MTINVSARRSEQASNVKAAEEAIEKLKGLSATVPQSLYDIIDNENLRIPHTLGFGDGVRSYSVDIKDLPKGCDIITFSLPRRM